MAASSQTGHDENLWLGQNCDKWPLSISDVGRFFPSLLVGRWWILASCQGIFEFIHSFVNRSVPQWVHRGYTFKFKEKRKFEKNKSNRVRTTDAFSGELPAYLSLNRLLNGIISHS